MVYLEPTIFYAEPSYVDDFSYFGVVLDDRNADRLIVHGVYPDSPAFIAGIRVGDEITTFHGKRVGNRAELARMLHGIEPGKVDLEFSHNGRVVRSEAKFNERVAGAIARMRAETNGSRLTTAINRSNRVGRRAQA